MSKTPENVVSDKENALISLSRLDNREFFLNAELIETIEMTPDTVITLTTGRKLVVRQSAREVVERIVEYKRSILSHAGSASQEQNI